jgi:hypothetical protein
VSINDKHCTEVSVFVCVKFYCSGLIKQEA